MTFLARASEISWEVFPIAGDPSEVSNVGSTVVAASGSSGGRTTKVVEQVTVASVNGVAFTDDWTMDKPSHMDTLGRRAYSRVSGYYQEILKHGDRNQTGLATWTFKDLKVGNAYQIQIWAQDNNHAAGFMGIVLNHGGIDPPVLNAPGNALLLYEETGENSPGQYAIGTFVADAATQQFQAQCYQNLNTGSPVATLNITINAYQLRDLGSKGAVPAAMTGASPAASGKTPADTGSKQPKAWDDDPEGIKVFILAGQSNMVGYGKIEEGGNPAWAKDKSAPKEIPGGIRCLREMAVNNANYPEYDYRSLLVNPREPKTSAWKTRSDVKLWWRSGESGKLGGPVSKGDLGPLTNNNKWFGPEYAFGQIVGDYYRQDDVLLIKAAWGGRALATDFRPPSAVAARGGEVGAFYTAIFHDVREVLENLGTEFPEWKGRGCQIMGFVWHQGYNDRVSPEFSKEYEANLTDLIKDVRKEFSKPKLPFVIASTGMGNPGPVEDPPYDGYTLVEKAQLHAPLTDEQASVLSTDTRPFWSDPKDAPSTVGHHWNHSAQSYFLIGKALGENMVWFLKN